MFHLKMARRSEEKNKKKEKKAITKGANEMNRPSGIGLDCYLKWIVIKLISAVYATFRYTSSIVLARSRRGDAVLISISLAKCLERREQRNPLNAWCALRVKHTRVSSIDVSRSTREIAGIYVTPRRTCCTRRNKAERNKGMWYNGASSDMMLHRMYVSIERYRRCSKTYYGLEYLNLNVRIPFRT